MRKRLKFLLHGQIVRWCDRKKADVISLTFGEIYLYSAFNFAVKSTNMYVEMTCEARISYKSIFEK